MISQRNPDDAPPPKDRVETFGEKTWGNKTWDEIWGRRIGRALAWIVAAFLLLQLLWTYGS